MTARTVQRAFLAVVGAVAMNAALVLSLWLLNRAELPTRTSRDVGPALVANPRAEPPRTVKTTSATEAPRPQLPDTSPEPPALPPLEPTSVALPAPPLSLLTLRNVEVTLPASPEVMRPRSTDFSDPGRTATPKPSETAGSPRQSAARNAPPGQSPVPLERGPKDAAAVDVAPKARHTPLPAYPRAAQRRGQEGFVRVRLLIDEDGRVTAFRILETSGPSSFREAVEKTVKDWRYVPARDEGRPTAVWANTTIDFQLSPKR